MSNMFAKIATSIVVVISLTVEAATGESIVKDGKGNSISISAINAMPREKALDMAYQLATKHDLTDAVTCTLVLTTAAAGAIDANNFKMAAIFDMLAGVANYVIDVSKLRGTPQQLIDSLFEARAKQIRYLPGAELMATRDKCIGDYNIIYALRYRAGIRSKIDPK